MCLCECIRAWMCTFAKHIQMCDQHQSKSLFFLSVAYRPLIIHSCFPAPSSNVENSIFSLHSNTLLPIVIERMCLGNKNMHRSILWKLPHNCREWIYFDVERCHMRDPVNPRPRLAQGLPRNQKRGRDALTWSYLQVQVLRRRAATNPQWTMTGILTSNKQLMGRDNKCL